MKKASVIVLALIIALFVSAMVFAEEKRSTESAQTVVTPGKWCGQFNFRSRDGRGGNASIEISDFREGKVVGTYFPDGPPVEFDVVCEEGAFEFVSKYSGSRFKCRVLDAGKVISIERIGKYGDGQHANLDRSMCR